MSRVVALGTRVGNLKGALVNHVVGSLAAALLVLLGASTLLDADAGRIPLGAVPAIYLTGGCAGVLVVLLDAGPPADADPPSAPPE